MKQNLGVILDHKLCWESHIEHIKWKLLNVCLYVTLLIPYNWVFLMVFLQSLQLLCHVLLLCRSLHARLDYVQGRAPTHLVWVGCGGAVQDF